MTTLRSQEKNGVLVVYFNDAKILDESKIQTIGQELLDKTAQAIERRILLNFDGVGFMSSSMLGKLVLLLKKCNTDKIKLKLCGISPSIFEVFKITNLQKIFDIHKDEERGLEAFFRRGWFR